MEGDTVHLAGIPIRTVVYLQQNKKRAKAEGKKCHANTIGGNINKALKLRVYSFQFFFL